MALPIRPVPARSAVLSLLLGCHPPALPVRDIVSAMELLGISETTTRVAVSRMVAAGDLVGDGGEYALGERLLERQRRQDAAVEPATRAWDGSWEVVVVTATRRPAADRAALRAELTALRLAELREGVWMRPANLDRQPPAHDRETRVLVARPVDDPAGLAEELWDLPAWAADGRELLATAARVDDPADRFAVMAATVRHLLTDPVLPPELLPADWPGPRLREIYAGYREELSALLPTTSHGRTAGPASTRRIPTPPAPPSTASRRHTSKETT